MLKKKEEEEEKKENHNAGWKVDENEKEACTFILNILRSYSSNLRLAISRLLRGSLGRISVFQFPK